MVAEVTEAAGDVELAAAYRGLIPSPVPWQRWFLIHALELLPGPERRFRFRVLLLLVARQNGKTTLMVVMILWRLFQDGAPKVIGTSTKLEQAEETWDTVVLIAELIPELSDEVSHVGKVNGSKYLQLDSLNEYFPQPSNSGAGRGWSAELVLVDELRSHKTWDTWSAISKSTTAKRYGQVFGVSNAADIEGVVLRQLRSAAIDAIEGKMPEGDLDDAVLELLRNTPTFLAEWSARPERSRYDRDGWYEANPSLGWFFGEESIAASLSDPEWKFRTEVLCQFVDTTEGGPFAEGSWHDTDVLTVERDTTKPAGYVIDLSHDRQMAHIGVTFFDTTGRLRVEIAASRAGTDWIVPWLKDPARKIPLTYVTFQRRGAPISSMLPELEEAGIPYTEWAGEDFGRTFGMGYDEIERGTVTHGSTGLQRSLNVAAMTARVKITQGGSWMVDRKASPEDVAPLMVFFGAIFLMRIAAANKKPSVYETRNMITL